MVSEESEPDPTEIPSIVVWAGLSPIFLSDRKDARDQEYECVLGAGGSLFLVDFFITEGTD